jgi:hypothetical protein
MDNGDARSCTPTTRATTGVAADQIVPPLRRWTTAKKTRTPYDRAGCQMALYLANAAISADF